MTSARPTFGDFLAAAYRHLSAAAALPGSVTPGRDVEDLADAVARVTVVLSRYTAELTRTIGQLPDKQLVRLGPWDRAAIQTHDALASATDALARGTRPHSNRDHTASQPARHLHAAATSLAAGRDLLQGHFSTEPTGARRYESAWSLAITSPSVNGALLAEVSSLALQTSVVIPAAAPPATSDTRLHDTRTRLNTARYWLAQPDSLVYAAERADRARTSGCEVLRAVPANVMPTRSTPENAERVSELLEAVVTTAERTRRAAWAAASIDPSSTAISVTSWHRIAAVSTATSHHCHLLYTTVAERVADDGGELRAALLRAAEQASRARELWLDSAREFDEVTTEIRGHLSPAALEAADLALWTGRLAYASSEWNLSSGPSRPVRAGDSLVPRLADLPWVIGAIHETSEALNSLAAANLQQARLAVEGRRLLVPTRSLPERYNVPTPFTEAPAPYAVSLVACCQDTSRAAARVAESSAEIAARVGSSSRTLAAARALAHDQPQARQSSRTAPAARNVALEQSIGPIENRLRNVGVTNARALWRAAAVDQAGEQVIRDATTGLSRRSAADALRASGEALGLRQRGRPLPGARTRLTQGTEPPSTLRVQPEAEL